MSHPSNMGHNCPLCGLSCNIPSSQKGDTFIEIHCNNCGSYLAEIIAIDAIQFKSDKEKAIVNHAVAKNKSPNQTVRFVLTSDRLEEILKTTSLPKVAQKIDNFVFVLGEYSEKFGQEFSVNALLPKIQAIIGALDLTEVQYLARHLIESGLAKGHIGKSTDGSGKISPDPGPISLSKTGWDLYEKISEGDGEGNEAFMAMPFGNEELDKTFKDHWKPAADNAGYLLERVDERPSAGLIDDHIRSRIRKAKFMLCELTGGNQGAYWEAGFAEGIGKPVIYLLKEEKPHESKPEEEKHQCKFCASEWPLGPHFDVNHHLHIKWNNTNLAEQAKLLTDVITETMARRGK